MKPDVDVGDRLPRILDIGPRFEVDLLHRLVPRAAIDILGIDSGLFPSRPGERYVQFNLNDAWDPVQRPSMAEYDLILMAEVLEHLHIAPSEVLPWVASLLVPGGHLLLQTPNAVALPRRLRMIRGRHPYEPLTTDRRYPGHIREYTLAELRQEGRAAGLEVVEAITANYFGSAKRTNRAYRRLQRIIPGSLRAGITIIYRAPHTPS
jgi:hypothetical protein